MMMFRHAIWQMGSHQSQVAFFSRHGDGSRWTWACHTTQGEDAVDTFQDSTRLLSEYVPLWWSAPWNQAGLIVSFLHVFREDIFYILKIDGGGGKSVYLYKRISLFPSKKWN